MSLAIRADKLSPCMRRYHYRNIWPKPCYLTLQIHTIATPTSPLMSISPEEFSHSSRENENSPRRGEIKLRKNEMKLRKNEMKVRKNLSVSRCIFQDLHGGIARFPPPFDSLPYTHPILSALCATFKGSPRYERK